MKKNIIEFAGFVLAALVCDPVVAADSYRYLHVSIDTPWAIFIFLLLIILFPFVLSAILYWYFTFKKHKEQSDATPVGAESSVKENKSQ